MKILLTILVITTVVLTYALIRKNKNKSCKIPSIDNVQKFIFGAEHKTILNQFKDNTGKHISADDLHSLTNIEPVRVHAILSDLVEHDLLIQSNTDSPRGSWLYILSDNGRKFIQEHK